MKTVQQQANSIARRAGYGRATTIIIDKRYRAGNGAVVEHTRFGYRKNTTDEYVPNCYLARFGWKNTYYQNALTIVRLNPKV